MKRLVGLIVLLGLSAAGLYYWRARPEAPIRLDGVRLPKPVAAVRDRIGDAALRVAVLSAFALNRRLQPLELRVEVADGVVTLRGEAPDAEARALAGQVARQVPEVKEVRNLLEVLSARPTAGPKPRQP